MTNAWENLYDRLYEEADKKSAQGDNATSGDQYDSSNPLYETLRNITSRYENETLIGEGGWKVIYRVYDVRAARDVALARPRQALAGGRYDAFLREAHITAKLEHANIIKLFDMGVEEDGTPFFTMEFKRGQSLNDRLRAARKDPSLFPLSERLQVFLSVCDAISYAHSRRVLHLDIKPDNIQVGEYGEVQVCDWGLGEITFDQGDEVSDSEALLDPDLYGNNGDPRLVKGTPGFMAPEQKKAGEPHTFQTDVYALGKTLEVLISSENIPSLSAVVAKATAESPSNRYQSVKALQDDVHRFVTLHPTSVEPGGVLREAMLFVRRHQRSCTIAAAGLVTVMVVSTMFLTELEIRRRDQAAAEAEALRARSDLVVSEHEKQRADAEAARATDVAVAMIEGRHQDAFDESLLLMNVMGPESLDGQRTLEERIAFLKKAEAQGTLDPVQVKHQLGYLHFVAQDFEQAGKYYEGLEADPDLRELIPIFYKHKSHNKCLMEKDFGKLIKKLKICTPPRLSLIEQMVVYDLVELRRKGRLFDRMKIVVNAIGAFNPGWTPWTISWNEEKKHLELRGTLLKTLVNPVAKNRPHVTSLLQLLQLKSLTLHDTGVEDLSQLSGMSLWQLELVKTTPTSFEPLQQMKSLRFLKVDTPELVEQAQAQLDKSVKVELIEQVELVEQPAQ